MIKIKNLIWMENALEVTFDDFKCVEKLSQFYKDSIENYEKIVMKNIFFKLIFNILKR